MMSGPWGSTVPLEWALGKSTSLNIVLGGLWPNMYRCVSGGNSVGSKR